MIGAARARPQCLNDVHVLVTMNWATIGAKGGRPSPRVSPTLTTVGHKLVMLGGAAHEKALNDVRVFEVENQQWTVPTVSGTPPAALVGHSATLVGTELFIFGGSDGKRDGNEVCAVAGRTPYAHEGGAGGAARTQREGSVATHDDAPWRLGARRRTLTHRDACIERR